MHYKKLEVGDIIFEFHNSWKGIETVKVNGQEVSKKGSVWGAHHTFTLMEDGVVSNYVLTSKVNAAMEVFLDLKRNGKFLYQDVTVSTSGLAKTPINKFKLQGIAHIKEYEMELGIVALNEAKNISPNDPEIYFHLACAYSNLEQSEAAYENIILAVENKLSDIEAILHHDLLAFMRIQPAFESFLESNFTQYDKQLLK